MIVQSACGWPIGRAAGRTEAGRLGERGTHAYSVVKHTKEGLFWGHIVRPLFFIPDSSGKMVTWCIFHRLWSLTAKPFCLSQKRSWTGSCPTDTVGTDVFLRYKSFVTSQKVDAAKLRICFWTQLLESEAWKRSKRFSLQKVHKTSSWWRVLLVENSKTKWIFQMLDSKISLRSRGRKRK